jgi:hypothetical protein
VRIKKIDYFSAADIQQEIGVARQTLWRWRKAKKIPQGRRYRDRQVVFTKQEVKEIREYANRLEMNGDSYRLKQSKHRPHADDQPADKTEA